MDRQDRQDEEKRRARALREHEACAEFQIDFLGLRNRLK
jgi:hypothetical protein